MFPFGSSFIFVRLMNKKYKPFIMEFLDQILESSMDWWKETTISEKLTDEMKVFYHNLSLLISSLILALAIILYNIVSVITSNKLLILSIFSIQFLAIIAFIIGYIIKYTAKQYERYDVSFREIENSNGFKYIQFGLMLVMLLSVIVFFLGYNYEIILGFGLFLVTYYYYLKIKFLK